MKDQKLETRVLKVAPEIRAAAGDDDDKPAVIVGYAAVFDVPAEGLPWQERILPGAFDVEQKGDVLALVDHEFSKLLGRRKNGTLKLTVDKKGLLAEITPPKTSLAADVVEQIRRGDVDGMSVAFRTLTDQWHLEDGEEIREIMEVQLIDVSVTAMPVYPQTEVGVRSREAFLASLQRTDRARYERRQRDLELRMRQRG
jgi:hypothetical protein